MRDGQPMIASKLELSPCAVSVLGQLFVEGRDRRWYLKVRTDARPEGAAVSHSESGAAVR